IAYWLTSAKIASAAACLSSSGAGKSGKPWARLTAPWAIARRFISRMTDSVNREALALMRPVAVVVASVTRPSLGRRFERERLERDRKPRAASPGALETLGYHARPGRHSSAVEQLFPKQQVLGSNPSVGSTPLLHSSAKQAFTISCWRRSHVSRPVRMCVLVSST